MSQEFQLCNDLTCVNYDCTAVFYVSLTNFRNIFMFETSEISGNALQGITITDSSSNIIYYVNNYLLPEINPAHAMVDISGSEGESYISSNSDCNLLKHEYIYYLLKEKYGTVKSFLLLRNKRELINSIELLGWSFKDNIENKFFEANNYDYGLTNQTINNNLTKRLLEHLNNVNSDRLTTDISGYNRIRNTTEIQSFPFIEGDSINIFWTINNQTINPRTYRIKLHLTDNTSLINRTPIDSLADQDNYIVYSYGVPLLNNYDVSGGDYYDVSGGDYYDVSGGDYYDVSGGDYYDVSGGDYYDVSGGDYYDVSGGDYYENAG